MRLLLLFLLLFHRYIFLLPLSLPLLPLGWNKEHPSNVFFFASIPASTHLRAGGGRRRRPPGGRPSAKRSRRTSRGRCGSQCWSAAPPAPPAARMSSCLRWSGSRAAETKAKGEARCRHISKWMAPNTPENSHYYPVLWTIGERLAVTRRLWAILYPPLNYIFFEVSSFSASQLVCYFSFTAQVFFYWAL